MVLSLHSRDDFAGAGSIEMIARRYYLIPGWFRVALLPIFHRDTGCRAFNRAFSASVGDLFHCGIADLW